MTDLSYRLRRNRVHLRLVAYHPSLEPIPEDHLRVVVQVVQNGRPIAEDPLHIENTTPLFLAREIHQARMEGWEVTPWERSN
jgi:hypothetical protein